MLPKYDILIARDRIALHKNGEELSVMYLGEYYEQNENDLKNVLEKEKISQLEHVLKSANSSFKALFDNWQSEYASFVLGSIIQKVYEKLVVERGSFLNKLIKPVFAINNIDIGRNINQKEFDWLAKVCLRIARKVEIHPIKYSYAIGTNKRGAVDVVMRKLK